MFQFCSNLVGPFIKSSAALGFFILYASLLNARTPVSSFEAIHITSNSSEPITESRITRALNNKRHHAYRVQTEVYLSRELLKRLVLEQIIEYHPKASHLHFNTNPNSSPTNAYPSPHFADSNNALLTITNLNPEDWQDSTLISSIAHLLSDFQNLNPSWTFDSTSKQLFSKFHPDSACYAYFYQDRNFFQKTGATFRSLARLHGVSVAVVWFSSELAQIAAIGLLTQAGLGEYALLAPVVPLSFVNTGLTIHIKGMKHRKKMRKGYGDRSKKRKAQKTYNQLTRSLQIRNHQSLVHFLYHPDPDSSLVLAVNNQSAFSEMGSFLRLKKNQATRKNLVRFTKHAKPEIQKSLRTILRNSNLSKELRIIDYVTTLKHADSTAYSLFTEQFSGSLSVQASPAASTLSTAEQAWLEDMLWIETLDSLPAIMKRTPQTLEVQIVYDLLMHIVLPTWADRNFKPGYNKLRNSIKAINNSRYKSLSCGHRLWSHVDWEVFMAEFSN